MSGALDQICKNHHFPSTEPPVEKNPKPKYRLFAQLLDLIGKGREHPEKARFTKLTDKPHLQ